MVTFHSYVKLPEGNLTYGLEAQGDPWALSAMTRLLALRWAHGQERIKEEHGEEQSGAERDTPRLAKTKNTTRVKGSRRPLK